jgi:hypothetical protein
MHQRVEWLLEARTLHDIKGIAEALNVDPPEAVRALVAVWRKRQRPTDPDAPLGDVLYAAAVEELRSVLRSDWDRRG